MEGYTKLILKKLGQFILQVHDRARTPKNKMDKDLSTELRRFGQINQLNPMINRYRAFCAKQQKPFDEEVRDIRESLMQTPIECKKYNGSIDDTISRGQCHKCLLSLS